ncbi:MAG: S9 family peptidase [Terracidiphilus sp.]|jgi:dipeptidyl aminopeptidase/acylaminoacyl peptidase
MRKSPVLLAFALTSILAPFCWSQAIAPAKRPMSFEDMMKMKRLDDTAVSADGRWLIYSATTVDVGQNTKTAQLYLQPFSGEVATPLSGAQPGDSGAQFAPDGRRILFLSSREGGKQIWVADFNPATGAVGNVRKLTAISTEADNALWSPDGRFIVFTSTVYPDCPAFSHSYADSAAAARAAKADQAAADAAAAVAENDNASTEKAANDAAALAAEANSAATVTDPYQDVDKCNAGRDAAQAASKVKAQIFTHLLYRHWDHFTGDKRSHLFLVPSAGGMVRDLTPNDPHDVPPFSIEGGCGCAFAPDSKELAFTENPDEEPAVSTNADIFTLDLTNTAAQPVKISTSPGGDFNPAYSPDGKWLIWRSQARAGYESDKFRLMLYNRATKTARDLLPKFDHWVDEIAWAPDSKTIYFVSAEKGEAPIYKTNLLGNVVRRYGKAGGEWSDLHPLTLQGRDVIVGKLMRVDRPAEVAVGDLLVLDDNARVGPVLSSYEPRFMTHFNDILLSQLDLPKLESFWFSATDGTKLQGFLIRPPGFDPSKRYPVKFLIHGGPEGHWGDSWSYRWNAELFAANGYVVIMVNFRGSTGYGQAFVDAINGDWGGKPFTDLMSGLDYAEQHYPFIDKNRECALGASYGGYMANWVLGHSNRFRCIVSHDGMFDPESAYGTTEELWFNEWEFKGKPWDYYGKPDAENPYRKWSPALSSKNFKTPTLVIHSQRDYRLDVSEGYQLFTTLQRLNVPSKMLYFPDEGHWVLKPQNSRLWYKTVNDWVDQWTK